MSDEPRDDETAGAPSKRVLTSGGAMEAQAYATANLRDAVRPTLEMDKVQITDPRNAITSRKKRPPIPDLPAVTPAPPPVASEGPVSTRGSGVLPPPSAPPRRLAPPPMPAVTPAPPPLPLPITPPPLPVTATRASDDDGADRPTLPRDDGEERVTLPTAHKSPFATPPGGVTSPSAEPAAPRRRSTLLLGIAAAAVIGLGGAWFALASRAPAVAATTEPEVAPIVTAAAAPAPIPAPAPTESAAPAPTESAAPAPIESAAAAPIESAAAAPTESAPSATSVAAVPRPEGQPSPPSPRAAPPPRPTAKPKAPAPASATPAKGRLFGVED